MHRYALNFGAALLAFTATANAATILFNTDPFAGFPLTGGRDIVPPAGMESFITFNPASDVFAFDAAFFNVTQLSFANDTSDNLQTTGINTIVLRNGPPLAAGTAANAIAARLTSPGAGFFIYFNSGLDVPRLVYSTNLDDNTADLRILARITNLSGNPAGLGGFTASNFQIVPEPSTFVLTALAGALGACVYAVRAARRRKVRG
jgi:hypothetical protein